MKIVNNKARSCSTLFCSIKSLKILGSTTASGPVTISPSPEYLKLAEPSASIPVPAIALTSRPTPFATTLTG